MPMPTPAATAPRRVAPSTERLLPMVRRIARQYHRKLNGSIDLDDLVQAGLLALVEAEQGFNDRGIDFSHYAAIRVRGTIIDMLRREGRMTRAAIAGRRALQRARDTLEQHDRRPATSSDLARHLGVDASDYHRLAAAADVPRMVPIDELIAEREAGLIDPAERQDAAIERAQTRARLTDGLARLDARAARVVRLYFIEEHNLKQISSALGVGAARVCQIKQAALTQLRSALPELAPG